MVRFERRAGKSEQKDNSVADVAKFIALLGCSVKYKDPSYAAPHTRLVVDAIKNRELLIRKKLVRVIGKLKFYLNLKRYGRIIVFLLSN